MSIKNRIIYLPVGEFAVIDDLLVQAAEISDGFLKCDGCALCQTVNCLCAFGPCEAESRPDGKNVIFVKVESDEKN